MLTMLLKGLSEATWSLCIPRGVVHCIRHRAQTLTPPPKLMMQTYAVLRLKSLTHSLGGT